MEIEVLKAEIRVLEKRIEMLYTDIHKTRTELDFYKGKCVEARDLISRMMDMLDRAF